MEKVDSAIDRDRSLAEAPKENLKSTYGRETDSVNIWQARPVGSGYFPQSKSVAELAKKSASGLREMKIPDEEGIRRNSTGHWKPQSSSSQNGLQHANKKSAIDGNSLVFGKGSVRTNFISNKTTPVELDGLKAQVDELINKLTAITPEHSISNFEDFLNELDEKIRIKWSFVGGIYAPSHVIGLYKEIRKLIDQSGSRAALNQIQNSVRDIEVSLNKALELRSIQNSLLASSEPRLKACKYELEKFARTPVSQDKIKAMLYDLMSLLEKENGGSSTADNNEKNIIRKNSHIIDQWKEGIGKHESYKFEDNDKQSSVEQSFENDIDQTIDASDRNPKSEKNTIKDADSARFNGIQDLVKEITELKGEIREFRSIHDKKETLTSADSSVYKIAEIDIDQKVSSDRYEDDDTRLKDLESQISHLSETVELLVVSFDELNNNSGKSRPNAELHAPVKKVDGLQNRSKNFTEADIRFFDRQIHQIKDVNQPDIIRDKMHAPEPIKEDIKKIERIQFQQTGILAYLDNLTAANNSVLLISKDLYSAIASLFKNNFYKLAVASSIPITLLLGVKIIDLSGVDIKSAQNLNEINSVKKNSRTINEHKHDVSKSLTYKNGSSGPITKAAGDFNDTHQSEDSKSSHSFTESTRAYEIIKNKASAEPQYSAQSDPLADFNTGERLLDGSNGNKDFPKAIEWLQKAARKGFVPAEYRLGLLYEKGEGIAKNYNEARNWYTLAAGHGNKFAMHNLASMIAEGRGGDPNYTEAANWFIKASRAGMRDSQYNLGVMYARGIGVSRDYNQSYYWFALAAKQGDVEAARKRDEISQKLSVDELKRVKTTVDNSVSKSDKYPQDTVTAETQSKNDYVKSSTPASDIKK